MSALLYLATVVMLIAISHCGPRRIGQRRPDLRDFRGGSLRRRDEDCDELSAKYDEREQMINGLKAGRTLVVDRKDAPELPAHLSDITTINVTRPPLVLFIRFYRRSAVQGALIGLQTGVHCYCTYRNACLSGGL